MVEMLLALDRKGLPNVASVGIICVGYLPRTYTHLTIILTTHADNRVVANMLAFRKVLNLFKKKSPYLFCRQATLVMFSEVA